MKKIAILLLASMLTITLSACNTGIEHRESSAEQTKVQTSAATVQTTPAPAETTAQTTTQTTTTAATTAPVTSTTAATAQTTAQTKAETTTTVQTAPAPEWTETAETGTKYITVSCYSRKKAILGAETVKLYNVNDKVTVTAKTDTGYYKLDTGAFVHSDYLSDNKFIPPTTTVAANQTTSNKPNPAPAPTETEQPFLVYAQHDDCPVYIDINCTRWGGCCTTANGSYVAVEILKDKGLYKVENAGSTEEGRYEYCYAKMSDFSPTKVYIDPIFNSPLNIAAIKQYMIDYGTKTLGLEYYERQNVAYSYDRPPEDSSWFVPRDIEDGDDPAWLKKVVEETIISDIHLCEATGGGIKTSFSLWIREVRDSEVGHTDGGRFKTEGKRLFEIYVL